MGTVGLSNDWSGIRAGTHYVKKLAIGRVAFAKTIASVDWEWGDSSKTNNQNGEAILLRDGKIWPPYQTKIKSHLKISPKSIYEISKKINLTPSLYLEAGAVHGCVIIKNDRPIIYMEDVGRHNAVDKITGYMFLNKIKTNDKIFYTTGRLTSEMIIKTVKMKIPILISRSGFTSWGVELAVKTNLTLIGRAKGKRYTVLSGTHRIKL